MTLLIRKGSGLGYFLKEGCTINGTPFWNSMGFIRQKINWRVMTYLPLEETHFFSLGIQFASQRMVYEFSYQYPMLQDLHGDQVEIDYKLAFSLRYTF